MFQKKGYNFLKNTITKKKSIKKGIWMATLLLMIACLFSCQNESPEIYNITWANSDGSVLAVSAVVNGTYPKYEGVTPTKPESLQYKYTFKGWNPEIRVATSDTTYVAQYEQQAQTYEIKWVNEDGSILAVDKCEYGVIPSYKNQIPEKDSDEVCDYVFAGWSPDITETKSNMVYTATYKPSKRTFSVIWKDGNGNILKEDNNLEYGVMPSYSGATPQKESDAQYSYSFNGNWLPQIEKITKDAEYVALFGSAERTYTVQWTNDDGTILETIDNIAYGVVPEYRGNIPGKADTAKYTYTFKGWHPSVGKITSDTTYVAQYNNIVRNYKITWLDGDETELKTEILPYGTEISYSGSLPTKKSTEKLDYTFSGWTPLPSFVSNDETFSPLFSSTTREYQIVWKDYLGNVLLTTQVPYGEVPKYTGDTPIKDGDVQSAYYFAGWNPTPVAVTGDAEYVAKFSASSKTYKITWLNYDGSVIEVDERVPYGATPDFNSYDPTKPTTNRYYYTFAGWDPEISEVKGDIVYTAKFNENPRTFSVTWIDDNGYILEKDTSVAYGEMPSYDGEVPQKLSSIENHYSFAGWDKELSPVTNDVTYVAVFDSSVRTYNISWVDGNGNLIKEEDIPYGSIPAYNGSTPVKNATAECSYYFKGWSPVVSKVERDVEYRAQFGRQYTINWKNYNDELLATDVVKEGQIPTFTGSVPSRENNPQYTYQFSGWSPTIVSATSNTDYIAQYSSTINEYTIIWKNHDGKIIEADYFVPYGENPSFDGLAPTKEKSVEYTYEFEKWQPEVKAVNGDAEYTAVFKQIDRLYTITWKNYDGEILRIDKNVKYQENPNYGAENPTRDPSISYDYIFDGWESDLDDKSSSITFTATFRQVLSTSLFGYTKSSYGEGYEITSYDDSVKDNVAIPEVIDGLPVISIGPNAFKKSTTRSIILPSTVKIIGDYAFSESALKSITLPAGLQVIGNSAFEATKNLVEISIPDSVSMIGERAFMNCSALESVTLPNSITEIKKETFKGCRLSTLSVPEGVIRIGEGAFADGQYSSGCSFEMPSTLRFIDDYAFYKNCRSITLPDSLEKIGISSFEGTSLRSIVIPQKVSIIPNSAFKNSSLYNGISFRGNILSIGDNAFEGCSFSNITLPESLLTIGEYSFSNCNKLIKITIPRNIATIPYRAFYKSFLQDGVILNGVTEIGDEAFGYCELKEISFPEGLIKIGERSFKECYNLSELIIPSSVETIGEDAFYTVKLKKTVYSGKKDINGYRKYDSGASPGGETVNTVENRYYYGLSRIIINKPKDSISTNNNYWGALHENSSYKTTKSSNIYEHYNDFIPIKYDYTIYYNYCDTVISWLE